MANVARHEGHRALYCGLVPGLQRQMVMSGLRLGLYERVREGYRDLMGVEAGLGWGMLAARVLAGLTTGSLAICVAQPMDVVKIRMQVNIMVTRDIFIDSESMWRELGPDTTESLTPTPGWRGQRASARVCTRDSGPTSPGTGS